MTTPEGDLSDHLARLGETRQAIQEAGLIPADAEWRESVEDDATWQFALTDQGIDYRFRDGTLAGVVLHVSRPTGSTLTSPDTLIAGVPAPATRDDVLAALGAPTLAGPGGMSDLFRLSPERTLTITYRGGSVASVILAAKPTAPAEPATVASRTIVYTDRFGSQTTEPLGLAGFTRLYDALSDPDVDDVEHTVVSLADSDDWYLELSATTATLGRAEEDDDEGDLPVRDRDHALQLAALFLDGDLAALRAQGWR